MTEFLTTVLTFPTVVWTVLLGVALLYWLLAASGLGHQDHVHADGGGDIHVHVGSAHGAHGADGHVHHADHADGTEAAGLLSRLGLSGVPLTLVLTLLTMFGWLSSYFVQLYVLRTLPDGLRDSLGMLTALLAVIPAYLVTNVVLRPLRPLFAKLDAPPPRLRAGAVGRVTNLNADGFSGVADFDDGGAGVRLNVHSRPPLQLRRGARVVLLDDDPASRSFLVTPEEQFDA